MEKLVFTAVEAGVDMLCKLHYRNQAASIKSVVKKKTVWLLHPMCQAVAWQEIKGVKIDNQVP
jgi:hypothetical protein